MSKRKHHLVDKALKLPKTDFPSLGIPASSSPSAPPLLLLQLPSNLTTKDLIRSHFVLQHDSDKCRLVSEDKGLTFDLVKVETSNSYVLIKDEGDGDGDGDDDDDDGLTNDAGNNANENENKNAQSSAKTQDKEARLVRENNTFFLECIPMNTDLESQIEEILKSYLYPTMGISLDGICQKLMHSKKEVHAALVEMKAFNIHSSPDSSSSMYGMLSEEMEREVWYVIRRVLSEWDGGNDYAGKGVVKEEMIKQVMQCNDGSEDDIDEGVLRHCLEKCTLEVIGDGVGDHNHNRTRLNVDHVSSHTVYLLFYVQTFELGPSHLLFCKQIARIVAHHVFNMKTTPWETEAFIQQWHNLMPGVGALYEPELGVIKDVALYVKEVSPMDKDEVVPSPIGMQAKGSEVLYLKYFPRENLPSTQDGLFKVLFKERARWKFDHLAPYVENLVKKSSFKTVQELLVKHAKVAPQEEDDEDGVDYYIAK